MAGIRERYNDVLKILSSCMPRLLSIVCKGRYSSLSRNYMSQFHFVSYVCVCARVFDCLFL